MKSMVTPFVIFSLGFFLLVGLINVNAQRITNSARTIDSLNGEIESLKKSIAEGSYTRIPNRDFENIIDNKIQRSMRETVQWWLVIVGGIISLLGVVATRYAKSYLQNLVGIKISELRKENEERIKT